MSKTEQTHDKSPEFLKGYETGLRDLGEHSQTRRCLELTIQALESKDKDDWDRGYTQVYRDALAKLKA